MKAPVTESIANSIVPTISLAIFAQIIALLIAIPIGVLAANKRGSFADSSMMVFALLGMSIPSFLLALLLVLLFGVQLGWLPVAGFRPLSEGLLIHLQYLILPAISLGAIQAALIARMTRSSMLEVLNMNYIKSARAKGVKNFSLILKHAFRNALLPILTVVGQTFGTLITGAVVVETVFNIPGIGQLVINSIERRDFAVIQGVVLFITVLYIFLNLIIDILYGMIDPRVRLDRK
jgi:peptide/nickel transport system permease protein